MSAIDLQRAQSLRNMRESKRFFPVIHVTDLDQCKRNVETAAKAGADGVFLISHDKSVVSNEQLVLMHGACRIIFDPSLFIGVNLLGFTPQQVFDKAYRTEGVWLDDGLHSLSREKARTLRIEREIVGYRGLVFGGVAFKYQKRIPDEYLPELCRLAAGSMDVIVTSGTATGEPPSPEKLRIMRDAVPEATLGIASGVDKDNVGALLDLADCFLVSTSIGQDFHTLDPDKTRELADIIHG